MVKSGSPDVERSSSTACLAAPFLLNPACTKSQQCRPTIIGRALVTANINLCSSMGGRSNFVISCARSSVSSNSVGSVRVPLANMASQRFNRAALNAARTAYSISRIDGMGLDKSKSNSMRPLRRSPSTMILRSSATKVRIFSNLKRRGARTGFESDIVVVIISPTEMAGSSAPTKRISSVAATGCGSPQLLYKPFECRYLRPLPELMNCHQP